MAFEKINNSTYRETGLGDIKPVVTIGGNGGSKFVPNINASFDFGTGKEEYFINFNRKDKTVKNEVSALSNDKVSQKIGKETDEYYIKDGRLKWDIVFDECPENLTIVWEVKCSSKLEFYHQPALTAKEIEDGFIRHDEVVGSYAVYCDKSNNKYKTGKLCHIYRPFIIDNNGVKTWCGLDISNGKLTVTLPSEIATAALPIRLDPNLGFTSIGASEGSGGSTKAAKLYGTPEDDGTVDSIEMYVSTGFDFQLQVALYANGSGIAGALLASNTLGGATGASKAWVSSTLSESISSGVQYWAAWYASGVTTYWNYDSCAGNEVSVSDVGDFPDPFDHEWGLAYRVSIYIIYTASGGGSVANGYYYMMNQ